MSTLLGSNTHLTYGSRWTGSSTLNQAAQKLTFPAGGPWLIDTIGVWANGKDVAGTQFRLCVWNGAGAVILESGLFSMHNPAYGTGNSEKWEKDVSTAGVTVAGGSTVFVGFARTYSGESQYDTGGPSGGTYEKTVSSWPGSIAGYSFLSGLPIQAWLWYELANHPPNAPTLTSPTGGTVVYSTPTMKGTGSDPDSGDTMQSYQIQVSTDSTFGTITHWDSGTVTTGITGFNFSDAYGGNAFAPGGHYYWRAQTTDNHGATGAWSGAADFYYNSAPNAPTITAPSSSGGNRITTATPTMSANGSDPNSGDTMQSYNIQVSTDSSFGTITHWNLVGRTTGITGWTFSTTYGGTALTRGTTYYWRCAMTDNGGLTGAWSAVSSFRYNALPTFSSPSPASATLGTIWNLNDLNVWDNTSQWAKCTFGLTPSDADGDTISQYRLRIYNDNAGVKGTLLYDSGATNSSWPSGVAQTVQGAQALVNGTQYWWSIDLYDGYEWMGESTALAFKVRWAQGLYEFDAGAGSDSWLFTAGIITGSSAIIFRSATSSGGVGATGLTAWQTSVSAVTKQAWFQWLVRLSTPTAGTNATLDSAVFQYRGTPQLPDGWTAS